MTTEQELNLNQIELRVKKANETGRVWLIDEIFLEDVPALIAEVKRLQADSRALAALREAAAEALDAYDNAEDLGDIGGAMERLQEALRAALAESEAR